LIEWLPEFALTYSEFLSLQGYNAADLIAKAARSVYMSDKYKKRGEIGELLLHVICREVFETYPAITKYFYKDSSNNTVNGFDAVHVIVTKTGLELWLGEAKFYKEIGQAIGAAVKDLALSQPLSDWLGPFLRLPLAPELAPAQTANRRRYRPIRSKPLERMVICPLLGSGPTGRTPHC
jgi:hypothetical protein